MSPRILALVLVAATTVTRTATAQRSLWRSVDYARQLHDTLPARIHVRYGAGKVDVRGAAEPLLYQMHLRYDEARSTPLHRFDADQRTGTLGLESRAGAPRTTNDDDETGELRLTLPRTVPLDLELELGGTQSTLDLGGMSLRSLRLECGAADARLSFTSPNRVSMHALDVDVGAADFTATQLANAGADQIRIRGGIGVVDLDFSGSWRGDIALATHLAVGKLVLRVPDDVGVQLAVERIAAGVEHEGFVKRDGAWYSPNWDRAARHLTVSAETLFGKIDVQRTSR